MRLSNRFQTHQTPGALTLPSPCSRWTRGNATPLPRFGHYACRLGGFNHVIAPIHSLSADPGGGGDAVRAYDERCHVPRNGGRPGRGPQGSQLPRHPDRRPGDEHLQAQVHAADLSRDRRAGGALHGRDRDAAPVLSISRRDPDRAVSAQPRRVLERPGIRGSARSGEHPSGLAPQSGVSDRVRGQVPEWVQRRGGSQPGPGIRPMVSVHPVSELLQLRGQRRGAPRPLRQPAPPLLDGRADPQGETVP